MYDSYSVNGDIVYGGRDQNRMKKYMYSQIAGVLIDGRKCCSIMQ